MSRRSRAAARPVREQLAGSGEPDIRPLADVGQVLIVQVEKVRPLRERLLGMRHDRNEGANLDELLRAGYLSLNMASARRARGVVRSSL